MPHSHAVVWMDSKEAHIFRFGRDDVEAQRIKAHSPFRKVHHKAGVIGNGKHAEDIALFDQVAEALEGVHEWLLVGPGAAKMNFLHHVEKRRRELYKKMVAIQAMDHPTDGELLSQARFFFKAFDKLQPNSPERTAA